MRLKSSLVPRVKVNRRRQRFDFGLNADAREHLRDRLADLVVVDVAVVRTVQGQPEAIRIAGLREQLAGALGIEGFGLERGRIAEHSFRHQLPGGHRRAFHHALDDRRAVDRFRHCAAHPQVLQRVLLEGLAGLVGDERRFVAIGVEVQIHDAVRNRAIDREVRVLAQAGEIRRRHAFDGAHVAGQQRCNARRVARDHAERHFVPRRLRAPVSFVAHELDAVALGVTHELERAGADRGLAGVEVVGGRAFATRLETMNTVLMSLGING
jgi:hypothetical protein